MTATANDSVRAIGALVPDPRFPGSVRIMVRGRLLLTVSHEVVATERLAEGLELAAPLYARLCRAADQEAAYRTTLQKLAMRPFAARDLVRRLILKGHPPEAAAAAVERARAAGLVDDAKFVRHFVETRSARGRGPVRLRRELNQLGVDRGLVDQALSEVFVGGEADQAVIEQLVRRRLHSLKGLDRPVLRRRLLTFLARRGFVGQSARATVERFAGKGGG
jgi:regulatory protein